MIRVKSNNQFEQHRRARSWLMGVVIAIFGITMGIFIYICYQIGYHNGKKEAKTKIIYQSEDYAPEDAKLYE